MRVIAPDMMSLFWVDRADLEEGSIREMQDLDPERPPEYVLVIDFRDARPVKMMAAKKKYVPVCTNHFWAYLNGKLKLSAHIRILDQNGRMVLNRHLSLAEETATSHHAGYIPVMIERRNNSFRDQLLAFYRREVANVGHIPVLRGFLNSA